MLSGVLPVERRNDLRVDSFFPHYHNQGLLTSLVTPTLTPLLEKLVSMSMSSQTTFSSATSRHF